MQVKLRSAGCSNGNHEELVNKLIAQGASKDWAVKGAAEGNHEELVYKLIRKDASKDWAVKGAAEGNHQIW